MKFEVLLSSPDGKTTRIVELERDGQTWSIALDGQPVDADIAEIALNTLSVLLRGESHEIRITRSSDGKLQLQSDLREFTAEAIDPRSWRGRRLGHTEVEGRQQIAAPMTGKVVRLLVSTGDRVEVGQGLLVVEAMKMQNEIRSIKSGTVERVSVTVGQSVSAGEILAWIS
jgi:biotin carboxyl carrier protein